MTPPGDTTRRPARQASTPPAAPSSTPATPATDAERVKAETAAARAKLKKRYPYLGSVLENLQFHLKKLGEALNELYNIDITQLTGSDQDARNAQIDSILRINHVVKPIKPENAKKLAINTTRLPSVKNNEGSGEWMFRCLNNGETDNTKRLIPVHKFLTKPRKKGDAYFAAALEYSFAKSKSYIKNKKGGREIMKDCISPNGDFKTGDLLFSKGRAVCGFIIGRTPTGVFVNTGKKPKVFVPYKDCFRVFHLGKNSQKIPTMRAPARSAATSRGTPRSSRESGRRAPAGTVSFSGDTLGGNATTGVFGDSFGVGLREAIKRVGGRNELPRMYQRGGWTPKKLWKLAQNNRADTISYFKKTNRLAILAGTNGIGSRNLEEHFNYTKKIIAMYMRHNPSGYCYVFTLFPQLNYWSGAIKRRTLKMLKRMKEKKPAEYARRFPNQAAVKEYIKTRISGKILRYGSNIESYNQKIRGLTSNSHVKCIDLYAALDNGQGGMRSGIAGDNLHPSGTFWRRIALAMKNGTSGRVI